MFKIVWRTFFGGMMLGALICLLFFSCAGIINYKKLDNKLIKLENSIENVYNNNNFIFFEKRVLLDEDDNLCLLSDDCKKNDDSSYISLTSSSGGALRLTDGRIYALTVAHFCVEFPESVGDDYEEKEPWDEVVIARFMGMKHEAIIEKVDIDSDLCLISFKHEHNGSWLIDKVKISKEMPKIGEKVYTISSPLGLNSSDFRLHFEGKFSGCDYIIGCLYTIPATFGSSGSLVFDQNGELVSVIAISVFPFQEVAGGSSVYEIRTFLKEFKQSTGIKLY